MDKNYIPVDWPPVNGINAWQTTRYGGHSSDGYEKLNLSITVGDNPECVKNNREQLQRDLLLPAEPEWIRLVHGSRAIKVSEKRGVEDADATYTNEPGRVLLIPTADCLPVLFVSESGNEIAAAHAGWRGLSAGILENTLALFESPPDKVSAWFGPAIGPACFEVGDDVRDTFLSTHPGSEKAFKAGVAPGKFLADIYRLGQLALGNVGVKNFYGGSFCTYTDERFFSYRRQGKISGRMASLIWMDNH